MLFAAIDIGSNAVRLYFANTFEKDEQVIVEKASLIRIPLRLGEDVFGKGFISFEKKSELIKTLAAFKMLIDVYKPIDYMAVATSAMREAENQQEIISDLLIKTGLDVKIISGSEEAEILCTLDCMPAARHDKNTVFVDVGGGSTEISLAIGHKRLLSESFQIGTVRMLLGRTTQSEWDRFRNFLEMLKKQHTTFTLVGSGGNINKLAKIYGHYKSHTLSLKNLIHGYNTIKQTPIESRITFMGMRADRADVIEPAAEIFITLMKTIGAEKIFVPKIGLTDGLIHLLHRKYS